MSQPNVVDNGMIASADTNFSQYTDIPLTKYWSKSMKTIGSSDEN